MNRKSLGATLILILALPVLHLAQTESKPAPSNPNYLTLFITLHSAYNPGVKLCTPIFANDPLEYSWSNNRGLVRSSISVLVSKPEDGVYPVKFVLKEGMSNYTREVKLEPKLELEKPYESVKRFTSGFELSYSQALRLSKEECK
jgi:hypothetical protein